MTPANPIVLDIPQRSDAWHRARAGVLTGSEFANIITPTGKPAKGAAYFSKSLAEWVYGGPVDHFENADMERGRDLEGEARRWYEMHSGWDAPEVGFVFRDQTRTVGCSPDGLIGENGTLEIKCPRLQTHIGYLMAGTLPDAYRPQVQGHLYVTGRAWCDFVSYYPGQPAMLVRVERDEEYIAALDAAVTAFVARLHEARARLLEMGVRPAGMEG